MSKLTPLINSWSAGAVTPRIHQRSDVGAFQQGADTMQNFICTSHGPFDRRAGSAFVASAPGSDGRIFGFYVSQSIGFIVATTTDGVLFVNDAGGNVIDPDDNLVANGEFVEQGDDWETQEQGTASVFFGIGAADLQPSLVNQAAIQQEITTPSPGEEHLMAVTLATGSGVYVLRIGENQGGGEIFEQVLVGHANDISFVPTSGTFWIEVSADPGFADVILSKVQVFDLTTAPTVIEFPTGYDASDIADLQVDQPSGEFSMYFITPKKPPAKLTYELSTQSWIFEEVVFIEPPAEWTGENFPGAITFHQGRMWLAGTPNEPEKFWASVSAAFEDFTQGDGTAEDESFEFELDARGLILWMTSVKNLVIGTENREVIAVSEGGILKAGDIQIEIQSAYGSQNIQSVQIGNQVLFVSPDGRKVRETQFKFETDLFTARDLIFFSEHLTFGTKRMIELVWMQNPENLLWATTRDGTLISATYERSLDIIGWHSHDTEGRVRSITVLESFGVSQLYWLVTRDIPGHEDELYLERYDPGDHLDSHVTLNFPEPQTAISVPHLSSTTVSILADGAVRPDVVIDENGDGVLADPASVVLVGLKYRSRFVSLPITPPTGAATASKVALKRWNKLVVSLLASTRPLINGVRPPDRSPSTPMNTAEPARTEYVKVAMLGYDFDAQITIEEDLPISTTINGIFGELSGDHL